MENVALWHERDISHSSAERVILPDATIALDYMLAKLESLVRTLRVNPDRMQANLDLTRGLVHSQQVLLLLTEKGVSRELGYRIVQRNAMAAWEGKGTLKELLAADPDVQRHVPPADLDRVFDLSVHFRDVARTFKAVGLGTVKPPRTPGKAKR
jgi:adenylosuccinate lyase